MTAINYLNNAKKFMPTDPYFIGSMKGIQPHFVLIAPKKLYEWTNYPIFDLIDMTIRGYKNLPNLNASWYELGVKTAICSNSGIRFLRFINVISSESGMPIYSFVIFTNTISAFYALTKGTSLIGKASPFLINPTCLLSCPRAERNKSDTRFSTKSRWRTLTRREAQ